MSVRTGRILPRRFYQRAAAIVARELIGKVLVKGGTSGIIVETEAYLGENDLASHSAVGLTKRTQVIFGPAGHAYVYFSYGMHYCMNIVAHSPGVGDAILLRALEPVSGIETMRERRGASIRDRDLASGPGKLAQAMGITLEDYGHDMTRGNFVVREPGVETAFEIDVTPRIGISKSKDLPLRFVLRRAAI